jgi:hypothetical protein
VSEPLTCQDAGSSSTPCSGPVEPRLHHWIADRIQVSNRCDHHWSERIDEIDRVNQTYGAYSDGPPSGVAYDDWRDDY